MHIAFVGSRGIPACYSGFETFVEQIAIRLVRRGHQVTVYNRIPFNKFREPEYQGIRLVHLPTIPAKATDTIVHSTLCTLHSLSQPYDLVYYCGVGSSLLAGLPRLMGRPAVVNVDGADFARAKWSGFGRWWLRQSETWASHIASRVIADNGSIKKRYQELYGIETSLIPYGSNVVTTDPGRNHLAKWGLEPGEYFLYVSRLTPENAADLTMDAYLRYLGKSQNALKLVVIGDAPYQGEFLAKLKSLASRSTNILMTGYQFGEAYQQLSYHARAFILPTAIDATRPVVLDQMGFGNCVVYRNTPGNCEVVAEAGLPFEHSMPEESLADRLVEVAENPSVSFHMGTIARERVRTHYDWEVITSQYEELFQSLRQETLR